MATHRFVKSDGSTLDITMIGQNEVNAAKYDLSLAQPPGGSAALPLGTGKPSIYQPTVDCYVKADTRTAARLAASDLYDFAKDAVWLERIMPDASTLQVLALTGSGESVASKKVTALSSFGLHFRVTLALRPNVAILDPVTGSSTGATATGSATGNAVTAIGA